VTSFLGRPSNPLVLIGYIRGLALRVKNFVILIAQVVLINTKLFALESVRAVRGTQNLFFNTI
jgi:hypothetical protein